MIAKLLISPSIKTRVEEINKILSHQGLTPNDPDLLYFLDDSKLGIAEARKIKAHFSLKPFSAKGRMVILEDASTLTTEAQNALLKTLEELPAEALFILGVDSDSQLLPTVISRCNIIYLTQSLDTSDVVSAYAKDVEKLLGSTIDKRFECIEKLKDREEFLHAMVYYFRNQMYHDRGTNDYGLKEFLKELLQAEEWASHNVNIRAILEYLMLKMPKIEV